MCMSVCHKVSTVENKAYFDLEREKSVWNHQSCLRRKVNIFQALAANTRHLSN